jgi:methionyl-tRNA synthetase
MKYGNGECPECGDPNGYPCTSCGYRLPESARVEPKPTTEAERKAMNAEEDAAQRARDERDELREHYL